MTNLLIPSLFVCEGNGDEIQVGKRFWLPYSKTTGIISTHGLLLFFFCHLVNKRFYCLWNVNRHFMVSGASDFACGTPNTEKKKILYLSVQSHQWNCRRQCSERVCCFVCPE